ncbi:unnamed protein product [Lepeophtheirus salmonis]|uniref:(salmon louse) hypothetical protein n=1 Tax=Lepeophtheirus salmonis TaxID=72036 RepID=A0A7R8HDC7_LEPSM|nr:unnamed protein product [Lepeophtheirus salmonis]CAF3027427.1 unnamed protein product [Lepeophtheirus salmonis]
MIGKAFVILILTSQVLSNECGSVISSCTGDLPKQVPWLVSFGIIKFQQKSNVRIIEPCNGLILHQYNILTVASCVDPKLIIQVYAGPGSRGQELEIKNIHRHEKFQVITYKNNIALVTLKKPIDFTEGASAVCLPEKKKTPQGKKLFLSGYARRGDGLKVSKVKFIKDRANLCKNARRRLERPNSDKEFCTMSENIGECTREKGSGLIGKSKITGKCTLYGLLAPMAYCDRKYGNVAANIAQYLYYTQKQALQNKLRATEKKSLLSCKSLTLTVRCNTIAENWRRENTCERFRNVRNISG